MIEFITFNLNKLSTNIVFHYKKNVNYIQIITYGSKSVCKINITYRLNSVCKQVLHTVFSVCNYIRIISVCNF